jgi:hypothetical protein
MEEWVEMTMQNLRLRLAKIEGTLVSAAKPQRVIRVVGTDVAEMTTFLSERGYGEDQGDFVIMHRIVTPAGAPSLHRRPYLLGSQEQGGGQT